MTAGDTVGVVGLGTMGAGIAEVFARHGFDVVGVEADAAALERGRGHLDRSLGRAVARGRLTEQEAERIVDRVSLTTETADTARCGLVVEAVVERLSVKQQIFHELDGIVGADAVLASNTSSLSLTDIAAATAHPQRVVGMHFFNPAPVQRLVEVVRTVVSDPQVVDRVAEVATRLGKRPVVCADRAGFIANALLFGYLNRAVTMVETGFATRADIDTAMRHGCGYPMGPLALLDLIGLDTGAEILSTMHRQGRNRLHAPAPVLAQLVGAGLLGRKSGRGFYTYEAPNSPVVVADDEPPAASRRTVALVAVVGSGPVAERLAAAFGGAGLDVARAGHSVAEDWAGVGRADLVVDATEGSSALERLAGSTRSGAILVVPSRDQPVVSLAASTDRPADVVGLHVIDPSAQDSLVEVVSSILTAADAAETVRAVCAETALVPVSCQDRAGGIVDALLAPYLNDAVRMLEAHYASAEDIDAAMTLGCALPAGPFALLERIGTDVVLATLDRLHAETPEPGLAPAPLLAQAVTAGRPLV